MNLNKNQVILIACSLILFGIIMRLMPHAPNATPIVALAFVGSLYLGRRWSIILPLMALLLSDLLIGFYDWRIMFSVYGSFALIGFLSWICRKYNSFLSTGVTVITGSLLFFLLTNTAVWLFSPWYEKSISGLLYAYELGLPFLRNMLTGDIVYTLVLIGVFEVAFALSRVKVFSVKTA
ncbi:hypothetical protein H6789_00960 [Candidatus Nomurabacteria bacterium]|nr:hypothetical protein [Candidatus Nomurabacteria bacterium]